MEKDEGQTYLWVFVIGIVGFSCFGVSASGLFLSLHFDIIICAYSFENWGENYEM